MSLFRFDWFFKSRTPPELQRRADTLIRLIEKELEDENVSRVGGVGWECWFLAGKESVHIVCVRDGDCLACCQGSKVKNGCAQKCGAHSF